MAITKNSAKCLNCGDIIESTYRHDFVTCTCWKKHREDEKPLHGIFVDGGRDYCRHGWCNADEYQNLSSFHKDPEDDSNE